MSSIPVDRIAVNEILFSNTGVDYFGHIIIKSNTRTRSTQPTEPRKDTEFYLRALLHADYVSLLRRLIARHGHMKILRSDNGSNFKGTEKELKHALTCINKSKVAQTLSKQHIQWKFNPPVSPWMGGVWKAF